MEQLSRNSSTLPFDVGVPGEADAPPSEEQAEGHIPGYREPHVVCANCTHFDGDAACQKYNAPADMDGSCPSFEEGTNETSKEGPAGDADADDDFAAGD